MRKGWWQYVAVCLMLVACGASSKKKVSCRESDVCVPGEEAGAPDAGPDVTEAEGGADAGSTEMGGADAGGGAAGAPGDAGTPDASIATLEVVIEGDGTVAVGGGAACLESPCQYPAIPGGELELEANPAAGSRFVGWSGDCAGTAASTAVAVTAAARCIAKFVIQRAVSVAVDSAGGGSVLTGPDLSCGASGCIGVVDDQSIVTLTASATAGFRFLGWAGGPDCNGATQSSLTIDVTRDLSCTAKFSQVYTLSVSAAGASGTVSVTSGTCTAATCTADAGSSASFSAGQVTGFRFSGWSGSSVCTGAGTPLQIAQISSNVACVANYVARFKVTGLVGGGLAGSVVATSPNVTATCSGNSCSVDTGTSATLVAPTVPGSRLTGWTGMGCTASGQSGNGIAVTPTTADVTCTANYAAGVSVTGTVVGATGAVTVTSTSPGASCTTGSCSIDAGGTVALSAPNLLPGFRFKGWTGDAGCTGASLALSLASVQSSKACTANYVQELVIAAQAGTGGTATAAAGGVACAGNSCTVDAGTSVVLTATADAANGYHFTGWTGANCAPAASSPLPLSNVNATCKAGFALNTFVIAANAGASGSVTATRTDTSALCAGNTCTVNFGIAVSLVATPALHFHFVNWTGAGCTPTGSATLSLENLNATCSAAFATDTFAASVTASPLAGGTVAIACPAGSCGAVPYGQLVNVSATANTGWSFSGWSANCNGGAASPNAVTITANTACVATFRPVVTGSVSPTGSGTITASGSPNATCTSGSAASCTVDPGGSVSFVAVPANDAVFTGWSGDCTGTALTAQVTAITAPKACTANFYRLWAQATGSVNADGMANVTALADGTVVGFGLSTATDPTGAQVSHMALVSLDANTGKLGQNTLFTDLAGGGSFAVLGLATTPNQKNVIALGVHAFANSQLPWLHNEQAPAWEFEYGYSDDGLATGAGGEVIATLDGGYAFTVGVTDPKLGTMAHLTKVDASGKPLFDTQFCAPGPVGAGVTCAPTQPVDVLEDATGKYFVVLSQVANANTELMLTFLDETGKITGGARYADQGFNLHGVQFAPGPTADTFLVVGFVTNPKSTDDNAFYALLNKAGTAPAFAVSLGAANANEALTSVARTPNGYGFSGLFADPKLLNEAWLVLSDAAGKLTSQVAYGGPGGDRANAIVTMPAGGFALGGGTNSFGAGGNDMWTLRVAGDGGLTFNTASAATRYATAFPATAVTLVINAVTSVTQGSVATQSKPAVSSGLTGFAQAAQAP